MAIDILLAGLAVVGASDTGHAQQPTPAEIKRWTREVPPKVMKRWLATMPRGSSPEQAMRTVLDRPQMLNSLRVDEDIRQHVLPTAKQINTTEKALSAESCIGNLIRWSRRYSFAIDYPNGRIDGDAIWFSLREAGRYGFHSGRQIGKPRDFAELDDRQFLIATGTYHLKTHRVKLDACGNNRGVPTARSGSQVQRQ